MAVDRGIWSCGAGPGVFDGCTTVANLTVADGAFRSRADVGFPDTHRTTKVAGSAGVRSTLNLIRHRHLPAVLVILTAGVLYALSVDANKVGFYHDDGVLPRWTRNCLRRNLSILARNTSSNTTGRCLESVPISPSVTFPGLCEGTPIPLFQSFPQGERPYFGPSQTKLAGSLLS